MISDYGTLTAAVSEWLVRPDLTYGIPEFISLAEERISRDIRCRQMVTTASLSALTGVETVALPERWIEGVSLRIETPRMTLDYLTPEMLRAEFGSTYSGLPSVYTIEGENIVLGPLPAQDYTLRATYYQRFASLESTNTNALIAIAPSLYLFAALAESAPYLMDDERVALWENKYAATVRQVNATQSSASTAGTSMRIRSR